MISVLPILEVPNGGFIPLLSIDQDWSEESQCFVLVLQVWCVEILVLAVGYYSVFSYQVLLSILSVCASLVVI